MQKEGENGKSIGNTASEYNKKMKLENVAIRYAF